MARVYLSLGSNLGDRPALLREAVRRLGRLDAVEVVAASRLYEAEPWEHQPGLTRGETPSYLNCVAAVETPLPPHALPRDTPAHGQALSRAPPAGTPDAGRLAPRAP